MTLGRRLRPLALVLVAAGVVALAAVPALAAEVDVQIVQKAFSPAQLTVAAGDTVVWTVTDGTASRTRSSPSSRHANAGTCRLRHREPQPTADVRVPVRGARNVDYFASATPRWSAMSASPHDGPRWRG